MDEMKAEVSIAQIEKARRRADGYALKGVFCVTVGVWAFSRAQHYFRAGSHLWMAVDLISSMLFVWGGVGYFLFAWKYLRGASAVFYTRRYLKLFKGLRAENYSFATFSRQYRFSKWRFWRAKDLAAYEKTLCDYIRSYRRAEDLAWRERKWAAMNRRLTGQLTGVLEEFAVPVAAQAKIVENFSSIGNPRRRKEFIESMVQSLAYRRWKAEYDQSSFPAFRFEHSTAVIETAVEDVKLRSLESQASKVVSEEARAIYEAGVKAESRRDRIRFFKHALSSDVKAAEADGELAGAIAFLGKNPSPTVLAEVKHISLQNFVRERLAPMESLVADADWKMCREVLLVLAEPGRSGGRFKSHYYAEDSLRRSVRRQCDMYADISFDPSVFKDAVKWLLAHGVVTTKTKTDERTISLLSHVKGAATPEAGKIIGMVLAVKREMSGVVS